VTVSYSIRDATPDDIHSLVSFALQEIRQARGHEANDVAVRRGVREPRWRARRYEGPGQK